MTPSEKIFIFIPLTKVKNLCRDPSPIEYKLCMASLKRRTNLVKHGFIVCCRKTKPGTRFNNWCSWKTNHNSCKTTLQTFPAKGSERDNIRDNITQRGHGLRSTSHTCSSLTSISSHSSCSFSVATKYHPQNPRITQGYFQNHFMIFKDVKCWRSCREMPHSDADWRNYRAIIHTELRIQGSL